MTTPAMPAALPARIALPYLGAAVLHGACTGFALRWLICDWNAQWADDTFVHAVYLSYGGMLIPAFGIRALNMPVLKRPAAETPP
jgi:hypothetical protein